MRLPIRSASANSGALFLLKPIAENIQEVSDRGQLLADAVVQVVADAALLASADFQNLPLQSPALGDVAGDAFDFHDAPLLLDQASADFQFDPMAGRVDEIPFRRGHIGAFDDLIEPLASGDALILGHQIEDSFATAGFRGCRCNSRSPVLLIAVIGSSQVVGEHHVVGVLEKILVTLLQRGFRFAGARG